MIKDYEKKIAKVKEKRQSRKQVEVTFKNNISLGGNFYKKDQTTLIDIDLANKIKQFIY